MGERDSLCTLHCDDWVREGGWHTSECDFLDCTLLLGGEKELCT
jgi:hypothetical protein